MNTLNLVKTAASLITGLGVGTVVGNLIKATTPEKISLYNKVLTRVGAFVIGGVVSELAANAIEKKIDTVAEVATKTKDLVKTQLSEN